MGHCFPSALFHFPLILDGGQGGERMRENVTEKRHAAPAMAKC